MKRAPCSSCGDNPPFKERGEWRSVVLRGRDNAGLPFIEGMKFMCGNCLLPLRVAWASHGPEKTNGTR